MDPIYTNPILTFIVPVYKPTKNLDLILYNLLKQKHQNFHVIIVIDKPSDEDYEAIDKFKKIFANRLKIIINTVHQNIVTAIKQATPYIKTEYTQVFYSYLHIKSEYTMHLENFINNTSTHPDFIEVSGYCRGVVKHNFFRDKFKEEVVVDLSKEVKTYSIVTPYPFNKIIKSSIFIDVFDEIKTRFNNLQYSVIFNYLPLLKSKTFAWIKRTWIEDWNERIILFNPLIISKEWEFLDPIIMQENVEVQEAMLFAKTLHLTYFAAGYLGQTKTKKNTNEDKSVKLMKKQLLTIVNTFKEENKEELNKNRYFKLNEVQLLSDKDFQNPSNWDWILKNFTW
ncbi:glycosyl transferase family 2 [Metamycoplasma subdolum]|uniref:Glycosyl transferase family 2 n=1 Tax=Metamycoplasma subdolum TaxID=92407 RepID=A0A3M0A164_9BACT|nr:glycosyltransferase family A protein [Metamycoplasma subdolum]RMA78530.1 glycosyl transferase family 2 [Metamycoplasma subdolum]WPB50462.1 glycosyltransferase family A protein [Metamycoplasma subdolum]